MSRQIFARNVPLNQLHHARIFAPVNVSLASSRFPDLERFIGRATSEIWDAVESVVSAVQKHRSISSEKVSAFFTQIHNDFNSVPSLTELISDVMINANPTQLRERYISKLIEFIQDNRNNAPVLVQMLKQPLPIAAHQAIVVAAREYLSDQGCDLVLSTMARQIPPILLSHTLGQQYRDLFDDLRKEADYSEVHDGLVMQLAESMKLSKSKRSIDVGVWADDRLQRLASESPRPQVLAQVAAYTRDASVIRSIAQGLQTHVKSHPNDVAKIVEGLTKNPKVTLDVLTQIGSRQHYGANPTPALAHAMRSAIDEAQRRNALTPFITIPDEYGYYAVTGPK